MAVEFSEEAVAAGEGLPAQEFLQSGTGRIFVVPTNDEADEIAAAMLAQLLDQASHTAIPLPVDFAPDERIGIVNPARSRHFLHLSLAAAVRYVADRQLDVVCARRKLPLAVMLDHIRSRDHLALGPDGQEASVFARSMGVSRFFRHRSLGQPHALLSMSQRFLRQKRQKYETNYGCCSGRCSAPGRG